MKKILLFIIFILIIFLCSFGLNYYFKNNQSTQDGAIKQDNVKNDDIIPESNEYIDNNPITVGLYKYYGRGKDRILIKDYITNWSYHNDISSFEVYYTNIYSISGNNQKDVFDDYKNIYNNIDNYHIGYIINFLTKDEEINKTIISPKDTEYFYKYLEVYLYDDYHRNGEWYSHTTEEEFNDNTILTSIKLTAGKDISLIISDITLTVFTYDEDDFDNNGNYIGNSKYSIIVKRS